MLLHLSIVPRDDRRPQARFNSSSVNPTPPLGCSSPLVAAPGSAPPAKLLDQVRTAIRVRHYSLRTEDTYVHWIKRFILFHGKRHPREMGEAEIGQFLSALAVEQHVSAATQNQALNAMLFLYRHVLTSTQTGLTTSCGQNGRSACPWSYASTK